jgi:hypothetical protein
MTPDYVSSFMSSSSLIVPTFPVESYAHGLLYTAAAVLASAFFLLRGAAAASHCALAALTTSPLASTWVKPAAFMKDAKLSVSWVAARLTCAPSCKIEKRVFTDSKVQRETEGTTEETWTELKVAGANSFKEARLADWRVT